MNRKLPLPTSIQPITENYISLVNKQVPDLINSFYIVGSIALDEFNEQFSDIDFLAILNRKATAEDIEELRHIHHLIERNHPQWKMSGSYLRACDLGKLADEIEPHPYYHDGVLHPNSHAGLNPVTWWELKNRGIALAGPQPQELPFSVDGDQLATWMRENMNSYWRLWANRPGRILVMSTGWGMQWAVLGVLRQFYTFRENTITTKVRAAQYALGCLPARWHKLIQEAVNIRQGKKGSAYRFRIARTIEAIKFLKYIIQLCNTSSRSN